MPTWSWSSGRTRRPPSASSRPPAFRVITISNFSPPMLKANAEQAGIADLFDELLSTETNGTYKPDPRA